MPLKFEKKIKIKDVQSLYLPFYAYEISYDVIYSVELASTTYSNGKTSIEWTKDVDTTEGTPTIGVPAYYINKLKIKNKYDENVIEENQKFARTIFNSISRIHAESISAEIEGSVDKLEPEDSDTVWSEAGKPELINQIEATVSKFYSQPHRNIEIKGNMSILDTALYYLPAHIVEYSYKGKSYFIIFDGADGKAYGATVPNSFKSVFGKIAKWILTIGFAALDIYFGLKNLTYRPFVGMLIIIAGAALSYLTWTQMKKRDF